MWKISTTALLTNELVFIALMMANVIIIAVFILQVPLVVLS